MTYSGRTMFALLAVALVAVASLAAIAQEHPAALVLTHANLIDGSSPEPVRDATVIVRGRQVESVGRNAGPVAAGAKVIDLKGRWLLPGFVDAHGHLNDLESARRALKYGTTTVRVVGSSAFADVGMRELHNAGATDIPAIVAAGYQLRPDVAESSPGSFVIDFPNLRRLTSGLKGVEDLRAVVQGLAARHVDLIKVLASERSGNPNTDPRKRTYTDEELAAIVDEARKFGLPVAAHAHSDEAARAAVLAGVRSIEHGTLLSDETLALMKARGTYLDPTISVYGNALANNNPILQQRARAMQPRARDTAARAWKMGIKIVAGTDSGFDATGLGLRMPDEIAELVRAGMSPMDAIKAGTSVSAECLGIANRAGAIKPGMTADFVAVDRDPLSDITALQDIVLIIHDGEVVVNRLFP